MADDTPETVPHAQEALQADAADAAAERRRKNRVTAGVAVGIGSAAIVAALLYANRGKRDKA
jgi:hypothetical protein